MCSYVCQVRRSGHEHGEYKTQQRMEIIFFVCARRTSSAVVVDVAARRIRFCLCRVFVAASNTPRTQRTQRRRVMYVCLLRVWRICAVALYALLGAHPAVVHAANARINLNSIAHTLTCAQKPNTPNAHDCTTQAHTHTRCLVLLQYSLIYLPTSGTRRSQTDEMCSIERAHSARTPYANTQHNR